MIELWRPIPDYEGFYEAGDLGNIRSVDRRVRYSNGSIRLQKGRVLKQSLNTGGYYIVALSLNGQPLTKPVHRLVLTTFKGPGLEGHDCCHNDGNKQNNLLLNLRWDTRSGNMGDKKLHGTHQCGEKNGNSKLTEDEVRAIRADSRSNAAVAETYSVSAMVISKIRRRKAWTHVA